ncbi:MAG: 5-(carboxyamino)imidazole ribonucleotide mutase [Gammaproteobacteria bacterium]
MGSETDLSVMQAAGDLLHSFDIPHEVTIVSAHRTPKRMAEYAETAVARGLKVIIAGAGGAAHLPGMVAALTILPVIGVPIAATALNGADALLSIVQMPAGVPVATVAINNAANAALLALQILALMDPGVSTKLVAHKRDLEQKVLAMATRVEGTKRAPRRRGKK